MFLIHIACPKLQSFPEKHGVSFGAPSVSMQCIETNRGASLAAPRIIIVTV